MTGKTTTELQAEARAYYALCEEARRFGISTSLEDSWGAKTVDELQAAVDAARSAREVTTFDSPLVIGQRVTYKTHASWGEASGSGVYLGVALDEEGGQPYHYFVDGDINGHAQRCHGFPAMGYTKPTTEKTPTELIDEALNAPVLLLDGTAHHLGEEPACPACGHDDVALWADDGEADAADWWACEKFSGGCGAHGAVVLASDHSRTLNGVAVEAREA